MDENSGYSKNKNSENASTDTVHKTSSKTVHCANNQGTESNGRKCSINSGKSTVTSQREKGEHSWILLASIFMFYVIIGFNFLCFGMYFVAWTDSFESTKAAVGMVIGVFHFSRSVSSKNNILN